MKLDIINVALRLSDADAVVKLLTKTLADEYRKEAAGEDLDDTRWLLMRALVCIKSVLDDALAQDAQDRLNASAAPLPSFATPPPPPAPGAAFPGMPGVGLPPGTPIRHGK